MQAASIGWETEMALRSARRGKRTTNVAQQLSSGWAGTVAGAPGVKSKGRFQSGLDSWCEETGGGGSGWSFGGAAMGLFLLACHDEKSHPTVDQQ